MHQETVLKNTVCSLMEECVCSLVVLHGLSVSVCALCMCMHVEFVYVLCLNVCIQRVLCGVYVCRVCMCVVCMYTVCMSCVCM